MLNKSFLQGRLTRDPDLRYTQSNTPVVSFTLAVDRDFKDKSTGEKTTDFIDVVAWRQTAEFVSRYFTKGRMAIVEGRIQVRPWTDKDGGKRKSTEIVADNVYFGDSKKDNEGGGYAPPSGYAPQGGYAPPGGYGGGRAASAPPQSGYPDSDYGNGGFTEMGDDDGELPF